MKTVWPAVGLALIAWMGGDFSMQWRGLGASLAMLLVTAFATSAAELPDDSKPAATNVRNALYPRVSSDGRVTFRVKAPDAQKVQIQPLNGLVENNGYNGLGKTAYDMTRDQDGYWTVTTPPVVPGLHYYYVQIDGATFSDPSSQTFFGANRQTSGVEVPEPGVDFYLPKDVPHGQIQIFWHYSKLTGQWRRAFVYLPPGYNTHPSQRYPVLHLRHGGGEDESGWVEQGHVGFILDNLIAAGKAKPMIVVMEAGYATLVSKPGAAPAPSLRPSPETPEIAEVTVEETIPAIDANFRTLADREHRAMAGLSLGSLQALSTTMHNLDKFSAVGVFSRPPIDNFDVKTIYGGAMADAAVFNKKVHLYWWAAGTEEEGIYNSVKATRAALDQAGIKYRYVEYPGLAHEWQIWRKQLNDFAPLLFRW
jgi:enterochelin esterase-like enzyme